MPLDHDPKSRWDAVFYPGFVRIESAFIAGHVEVDPVTESLDVRFGFQTYVRVPSLPFLCDLGLGMVVQIAMDEYGRPFTLEIVVDRVENGRVLHYEDFTFEIPFGIRTMEGFSHHHSFAFALPLEFYDVSLHSVIIGDGDSDYAHIDFVVQMVTLDQI
jgi:hypothetical protein